MNAVIPARPHDLAVADQRAPPSLGTDPAGAHHYEDLRQVRITRLGAREDARDELEVAGDPVVGLERAEAFEQRARHE